MNTAEILMFYEMFDDDDISTERLLAMTADVAGCDIDDVVSALAEQQSPNSVKGSTFKKSARKKNRSRNRSSL